MEKTMGQWMWCGDMENNKNVLFFMKKWWTNIFQRFFFSCLVNQCCLCIRYMGDIYREVKFFFLVFSLILSCFSFFLKEKERYYTCNKCIQYFCWVLFLWLKKTFFIIRKKIFFFFLCCCVFFNFERKEKRKIFCVPSLPPLVKYRSFSLLYYVQAEKK